MLVLQGVVARRQGKTESLRTFETFIVTIILSVAFVVSCIVAASGRRDGIVVLVAFK